MNAIINWLALNNTLMIKIGFSAIILLVVVYVFRFFFVPRVKIVSDAVDLSDSEVVSSGKTDVVKEGAGATSSEDVTKLQAEISTLKYKLKEAEVEKANLATQAASATNSAPASAGLDMVAETNPQTAVAQGELEEKIKLLEARLSEYEIIAEDIAEISKLRQENEELKAKISVGGSASVAAVSAEALEVLGSLETENDLSSPSEESLSEPISETPAEEAVAEASSDVAVDESQLLDDYVASKTAAEVDDSSRVVITSDVEISAEEKKSLNEFEQFKKMKKG